MHLEDVAPCLVEPGDDDQLLASLDPVETVEEFGYDLDRGVGGFLVPLSGRVRQVDKLRPNDADRLERVGVAVGHAAHYPLGPEPATSWVQWQALRMSDGDSLEYEVAELRREQHRANEREAAVRDVIQTIARTTSISTPSSRPSSIERSSCAVPTTAASHAVRATSTLSSRSGATHRSSSASSESAPTSLNAAR
jgi:hypothetical protein